MASGVLLYLLEMVKDDAVVIDVGITRVEDATRHVEVLPLVFEN